MRKRLWVNIARRVSLISALAILVGWFLRQYLEHKQSIVKYPIPTPTDDETASSEQASAMPIGVGETKTVVTAKSPPIKRQVGTDNLRRIEGIGPKIANVLTSAGIVTFAQLGAAEVKELRQILTDAGVRVAYPDTWPEQAALAATGDWEKLEQLQSQLDRGRRPS